MSDDLADVEITSVFAAPFLRFFARRRRRSKNRYLEPVGDPAPTGIWDDGAATSLPFPELANTLQMISRVLNPGNINFAKYPVILTWKAQYQQDPDLDKG